MNESEKQFSFTRAASITSGRENQILISLPLCFTMPAAMKIVPVEVVDGVLRVPKDLRLSPNTRLAVLVFEGGVLDSEAKPVVENGSTHSRSLEEPNPVPSGFIVQPGTPLAEVEKVLIRETLLRLTSNREEAAKALGISRRALQYKLKQYGMLDEPEQPAATSGEAPE